jgi:hypothetical protein
MTVGRASRRAEPGWTGSTDSGGITARFEERPVDHGLFFVIREEEKTRVFRVPFKITDVDLSN